MKKEERYTLYRKIGFYEKYIKRVIDIFCSGVAIMLFWWLYIIIALLVRIKLGSPVLFTQYRPGLINPKTGKEQIFKMYKFRTMTDKKDEEGNMLPDGERLTKFGSWLRSTSLDELPEVFCILNGSMALVGPRPQLIRDMVFMTETQRIRHTVRPGLTGLAQVNGRNNISWEEKLNWDLRYVEKVSFFCDIKIILKTVGKVLKRSDTVRKGTVSDIDFGEWLMKEGKITKAEYDQKQEKAKVLLRM